MKDNHLIKEINAIQPSKINKTKGKEEFFLLMHTLIKHQNDSFSMKIILIIIELIQLSAFNFYLCFEQVWKKPHIFSQLSYFFQYFHLVAFLRNNSFLYIIVFYLYILAIILVLIRMIYLGLLLKRGVLFNSMGLTLMQTVLHLYSTVLFIPIFQVLLSMFNCIDTNSSNSSTNTNTQTQALRILLVNYFSPNITCYENAHIFHSVMGALFIIIFFILCLIIKVTLTDSITSNDTFPSNFDAKLLFIKALLCIIFNFFGFSHNSWILLVLLLFCSFFSLYSYYLDFPHSNQTIKLLHSFSLSVFSWGSTVVFIGKVFEHSTFDGCIPLFILGIPIILIIILFESKEPMAPLLRTITNARHSQKALEQIRLYLSLFDRKELNRQSKIVLKGYAHQHSSTCTSNQCPLVKYIQSMKKGSEVSGFLLQHAEVLFQNAITQFPLSFNLRLFYCKFLLKYMNKKQQVNQELLSIENHFNSLSNQFIIYHFRLILEEHYISYTNNTNCEEEENSSLISSIVYNKYLLEFKHKINTISLCYYDFWTLILNNHRNPNQLTQINDYSTKINKQIEELNTQLDTIEKLKTNNKEAFYYYSIFLNDILNDKEKASKYEKRYREVEDMNQTIDDTHYFTYDMTALTSSDEYQYIILSGNQQNFGLIVNISLGVCMLLGYSKNELINNVNEIILPELYRDVHKNILLDKVNELRKKEVNDIANAKNSTHPVFKSIQSYARSKSRYLIPLSFQVITIVTEQQGISFVAKVNKESSNQRNTVICQVITDPSFQIQNFTVQAVNLLGMNSNVMNHNLELTFFIKEFSEEYLKAAVKNDNITSEQKTQLKKHIINKRFRINEPIIWRGREMKNELFGSKKKESLMNIALEFQKNNNEGLDCFLLRIEDIIIRNALLGYIFHFEKISPKSSNCSCKAGNSNHSSQNDVSIIRRNLSNSFHSTIVTSSIISHRNIAEKYSFKNFDSFLPKAKMNFCLDTKKMSYVLNNDQAAQFRELIKKQAFDKIHYESKHYGSSSDNDNYTDEEGQSNVSDSSSLSYSQEEEEERTDTDNGNYNIKADESPGKNKKVIQTDKIAKMQNEYYKVNMTNIKYSIYSYEKAMVVETPSYVKKSQVESKMFDSKESSIEEGKATQSKDGSEKKTEDNNNTLTKVNNDELLIKQIESALSREDNHQSITNLKLLSFGLLLIFLCIGVALLYIIIDSEIYLLKGFQMLNSSTAICYNAIHIHSKVKDLVLLSHENYSDTLYHTSKDTLISECISEINKTYMESSQLILDLITTTIPLSDNSTLFLSNKTFATYIITNNLTVVNFNTTLHEAFIEVNTAAYHITKDLSTYIPTNKWVYFYLSNMNNAVFMGLMEQKDLFFNEVTGNIANYKKYFIIACSISFALIIGTFFVFSFGYDAVSKQKESYLGVFFEISIEIITASIERCDRFIKKIQFETFHELVSSDETENEGDSEISYVIANKNKNDKSSNSSAVPNKKRQLKETLMIKIYYILFLTSVFIVLIVLLVLFDLALTTFQRLVSLFNSQNDSNLEYTKLYRNMREYIFDNESRIDEQPSKDSFPQHINDIYPIISNKRRYVKEYRSQLPESVKDMYYVLYYSDIWAKLGIDLTKANASFYTAPSYGLNAVQTSFIEDIRYIKSEKIRYHLRASSYKYNLTNMGLDSYDDDYPGDEAYYQYHPINLFKSMSYQRIKMIYEMFLKPGLYMIYYELFTSISAYLKNNGVFFYCYCGFYFFVIFCALVIIWIPFQKGLSNTIFTTKKMLRIIPKEILRTLTNVRQLLNIESEATPNQPKRK